MIVVVGAAGAGMPQAARWVGGARSAVLGVRELSVRSGCAGTRRRGGQGRGWRRRVAGGRVKRRQGASASSM